MTEIELRDAIIRLAIYIEGVKNHLYSYNTRFMRRYYKELQDILSELQYDDLGYLTKIALKRFEKVLRDNHNTMFRSYKNALTELLEKFQDEVGSVIYTIAHTYDASSELPEEEDNIWLILIPGLALTTDDVFRSSENNLISKILRNLRISVAQHESVADYKNRLIGDARKMKGGEIARGLNGLNSLTATSIKVIEQDALAKQFQQISEKYEWVSVLDSRTSDICLRLDNKVFIWGQGPVPPAHYRCRSTIKPYTGQKTPAFPDWIKDQPKGFIRDAFRYLNRSKQGLQVFSSNTIGSVGVSELQDKLKFIIN